MWLTRFSIRNPIAVAMFFIALAVFGVLSYRSLGASLNPNVTFPVVVVAVSYPGASPAEMERLIVKPIEDQLDGIENLDKLSATAQEGTAAVVVQFNLDTDLNYAAVDVQRRVDTARVYMPSDLDPPTVDKSAGSSTQPILTVALSSKAMSRESLADLIRDRIVPELKSIQDVQGVDVRGDVKREFHVEPDPNRMVGTKATLLDIFNVLQRNNQNLPGGLMKEPTRETSVSVHADINHAADVLPIPLPVPGGAQDTLTIGDVASASDGHVDQRIVSHYNGDPTVILDINRIVSADEIKSTALARAKIKEIAKKFPLVTFKEIEAPAEYTQASLNGVLQSLFEGIFLTAIVMLLFLHAWRNALVVMIAIPASLLATFIMMRILGFTLDSISLMGLSLTIGILVDDSIVVLENITRHRDMGENPEAAAIAGRSEIGGAAIAITLVDVVVFLPIAFLSGIVGKYMKEFGLVVVVATLFSLLVSFTLTPVLAAKWSMRKRSMAPPRWMRWFTNGFEALLTFYAQRALPFALHHRMWTVMTCFLLVLNAIMLIVPAPPLVKIGINGAFAAITLAGWALSRALRLVLPPGRPFTEPLRAPGGVSLRKTIVTALIPLAISVPLALVPAIQSEFIPSVQSGDITMTVTYPIGQPLAVTQAGVDRLENEILQIKGIETVISTVGFKPAGWGSTLGGNVARMRAITAKSERKRTNEIVRQIRDLGSKLPGATFTVAGEGGGNGDPIYFTLSGPEDAIGPAAEKLAAYIRAIPGTVNVQTGAESEGPRLNITIDPHRAALAGVSPGDAATVARIAIGGAVATRVRTESGLVDLRLRLPEGDRTTEEDLRRLRVRSQSGDLVPLSAIATFEMTKAPTKIERLAKQRVVRVTGGIDPGSTTLGTVIAKIQRWIDTPGNLPNGVELKASGDSQFFQETISSILLALVTSFALVYCLMVILYRSFLTPFVVMFSIPVAMVGALLALGLSGQTLNLFSMLGMVMLFGLVAKNGILLVDYALILRERGMRAYDAMMVAAETRFRPIMMTTAAMVFGMLPLALGLAEGAEYRRSMGAVLIGGLLSSLILTLFLVPVINVWIVGGIERRADRRARDEEHREIADGVVVPAHV